MIKDLSNSAEFCSEFAEKSAKNHDPLFLQNVIGPSAGQRLDLAPRRAARASLALPPARIGAAQVASCSLLFETCDSWGTYGKVCKYSFVSLLISRAFLLSPA